MRDELPMQHRRAQRVIDRTLHHAGAKLILRVELQLLSVSSTVRRTARPGTSWYRNLQPWAAGPVTTAKPARQPSASAGLHR